MWKQWLIAALLLGGAALLWQGGERARGFFGVAAESEADARARPERGVPVIVAPVRLAPDTVTFEAVGTGRAQRSVTLRSEAAGKVVAMALAPGARFAKDEPVLWLEAKDQRLALELAKTRRGEAERLYERYQRLKSTGATAAARFDEVQTAATIARLEAQQAQEALADRELRVPFDGVSGLPAVEVGDWIDSSVDLATFDDRSVLLVEFDLPELLLARVGPEMQVSATTPAFGGRRFDGIVSAIDTRVDPVSRTARLRVAIPNGADLLRPGASFSVRLQLPGETYPLVPELALQFARGGQHVWRIRNDLAEQVPVVLVRRREGAVLVDGELAEGDLVVVEGTQRLVPEKTVTVIGGLPEAGS